MKWAIGVILLLSLALNVFLWQRYERRECVTQVVQNVADTIYQTYYVTAPVTAQKGTGVTIGTIANAIAGTPNRSIIFTGGLEYMPTGPVPISYELGAMYFPGKYGIGYSYNPWLKSHQLKVGIRIGW